MLSPNLLKKTNFSMSSGGGGGAGGGRVVPNFQILMLSPNLLKTKFPYVWCVCRGGGGGCSGDQLATFNAKSKSAKILYTLDLC